MPNAPIDLHYNTSVPLGQYSNLQLHKAILMKTW